MLCVVTVVPRLNNWISAYQVGVPWFEEVEQFREGYDFNQAGVPWVEEVEQFGEGYTSHIDKVSIMKI